MTRKSTLNDTERELERLRREYDVMPESEFDDEPNPSSAFGPGVELSAEAEGHINDELGRRGRDWLAQATEAPVMRHPTAPQETFTSRSWYPCS